MKKILIVDYDPKIISKFTGFLESQGFQVESSQDGNTAIETFEKLKPDLVLLAAMLPKMHGFEVCQKIRASEHGRDIPVIINTGVYKGRKYRDQALHKYRANEYLERPFPNEKLLEAINNALGMSSSPAPAQPQQEVKTEDKKPTAEQNISKTSSIPADTDMKPSAPVSSPKTSDQAHVAAPAGDPVQKKTDSAIMQQENSNAPVKHSESKEDEKKITSEDLFGDMVEESKPGVITPPKEPLKKPAFSDANKKLEDTLSGILPSSAQKIKVKPRISSGIDLNKELSDTLGGLKQPYIRKTALTTPTSAAKPETKPGIRPESKPVVKPEIKPAPAKEPPVKKQEEVKPVAVKPEPAARESEKKIEPAQKEKPAPSKDKTPVPAAVEEKKEDLSPAVTEEARKEQEIFDGGGKIEFGQYELLKKIATGGMAELFLAKQSGVEGFQKLVAIKKILPHLSEYEDFVEMFIDEAKVAAQLNHQNIAQIYDLGVINNSYFIAMEYVHGKNVRDMVKKQNGPIPLEHVLYIGTRICSALDYAHRKKDFDRKDLELVHRDVSPQNFLLSYEGEVKLVDFGIAKAASMASHTHHGALKGKILYMSPEQAYGKKIDRRSDIFSFGSSMFEMMTGERLFTGNSEMEILEQVRSAAVRAPSSVNPDISKELDEIILKALAKYPDDRYNNAAELNDDLESFALKNNIVMKQSRIASYLTGLFPEEDTHLPYADRSQSVSQEEGPLPHDKPVPDEEPAEMTVEESGDILDTPAEKEISAAEIKLPETVAEDESSFADFDVVDDEPEKEEVSPAPAPDKEYFPPAEEKSGRDALENFVSVQEEKVTEGGFIMPESSSSYKDVAVDDDIVSSISEPKKSKLPMIIGAIAAVIVIIVVIVVMSGKGTDKAPEMTTDIQPDNMTATQTETGQETVSEQVQANAGPVKKGDLVELTPDVLKPAAMKTVDPAYPARAKQLKIEGMVFLNVLIDENGKVADAKVIRTPKNGEDLADAAIAAVKKWEFSPAVKNRVPVKVWTTVPVPFKL